MAEPELDETTIRLAARGDRAAGRRLVERYQSLVFATARRVLGAASPDVPDVAQDAFVRAFGALAGFDPRGAARLSTWLATITTRLALDVARRRRPVVSLELAREASDPEVRDPGELLDAARRRARLAAAMDRLTPEQRAAIVLRTEHAMSHEDVARAMGVEVGTVKSRLARARAVLAAAVGEAADDNGSDVRRQHG